MTPEERKALIYRCQDAVAHLKQMVESGIRGGRYSVTEYRYQLMINEIALAALTAQPVKLPDGFSPSVTRYGSQSTSYRAIMTGNGDWIHKEQAIEAIHAAGYEVQE